MSDEVHRMMLARALALQTEAAAILSNLCMRMDEPEPEQTETVECLHPQESRINTATMGSKGAFKCRDCGYEYSGAESTGG